MESGLQQLAAASLLRHEDEGRAFAMLTTVRADAQDRLARSGEAVAMRWAHAYQVLAVAEEAERALPTGGDLEALDRLEEAHDDIREALEWAMAQGDGTFALRLAGTLAEFWRTRGHHTEGRLRLAAALSLAVDPPPAVRRKALSGAGLLASYQGDYRLGEAYLREALSIAREMGDEEAMASCLNWLGTNAYAQRRPRRGRGVRVRGARDPPPDRRAGRDRAGAQRPGRRPPLPRRPRPRPRDVRREPVAQGGPRATRTGSRSR